MPILGAVRRLQCPIQQALKTIEAAWQYSWPDAAAKEPLQVTPKEGSRSIWAGARD